MNDPHDDTDVLSGSTDGAQMESTSSPVPREHTGPGPRMVGSSSQQRQLIAYHVESTEEEHPQPAPSPEHSLAYRRPTGGGR